MDFPTLPWVPRLAALLAARFRWPPEVLRNAWSQRYRRWRESVGPMGPRGQTFVAVPRMFSYLEPWKK